MEQILIQIRQALNDHANDTVRQSSQRFFKEELLCYGIKSATVRYIAKEALKQVKNQSKTEIFKLCEALWQSGYLEEAGIACTLAEAQSSKFVPEDFEYFERWMSTHVNNWASCDNLCNHTIGSLLKMYPALLTRLHGWTSSNNRWLRRGAAVSLIIPAREGMFLNEVIQTAEALLNDPDDLVQKGYGWALKAASEAHPEVIFEYLMRKKKSMPRTAFRYALEKMPPEWHKEAMKK